MCAMPERDRWTVEEYLEFERTAELRHEFFHGQVYAMVGATENHNQLASNLHGLFYVQFRESPCWVFQSEMRVEVAANAYFYPDLVMVCGDRQYKDKSRMTLLNPHVVIEILSPSTEKFDREHKSALYRGIPSLQEYLLVAQNQFLVEHFVRQSANSWLVTDYKNAEDTLTLSSVGCTLKLADIYERVVFDGENE